jgi:hypothetical protein
MALAIPPAFIGTQVSGDIAGYTLYTDRKLRNVAFPRHPPKVPRSVLQARQRARFAFVQSSFADQPQHVQEAWERASLTMSLQMTGRNLYTAMAFRQDEPLRQTLERQSGETLPMPPDPHTACP